MRSQANVFHLAIPTHDLEKARYFYIELLGCRLAREYADRITMDFFGDQVVCHLNKDYVLEEPTLYPRHFGITFRKKKDFDSLYDMAIKNKIPFFKDQFTRFSGKKEEHQSFFLADFSNNILEFKWYIDPQCMY